VEAGASDVIWVWCPNVKDAKGCNQTTLAVEQGGDKAAWIDGIIPTVTAQYARIVRASAPPSDVCSEPRRPRHRNRDPR
jgi:hypothetical protein